MKFLTIFTIKMYFCDKQCNQVTMKIAREARNKLNTYIKNIKAHFVFYIKI